MDAQATTAAPSGGFRDNNIVQAWLVLCLAICFGSTLAGMQLALGPTIEQNKINETMAKVPELVLGQELAAKMAAENQALDISPRSEETRRVAPSVVRAQRQRATHFDHLPLLARRRRQR